MYISLGETDGWGVGVGGRMDLVEQAHEDTNNSAKMHVSSHIAAHRHTLTLDLPLVRCVVFLRYSYPLITSTPSLAFAL